MILPTEHLRPESSLLGVGAEILDNLRGPVNVSTLWDRVRARTVQSRTAPITYAWFVLALDLLYLRWVRWNFKAEYSGGRSLAAT